METHRRSVAKAISHRTFATCATMLLVYIVTGNLASAGIVGGLDVIVKLVLYYLHERAWSSVGWGRKTGNSKTFGSRDKKNELTEEFI